MNSFSSIKHDKVRQAMISLIWSAPFFSHILMKKDLIEDRNCKTFYTDGVSIGYNPRFADTLTVDEIKGILIHEALHIQLLHVIRVQGRDRHRFNRAADMAINPRIIQAGYKLPKRALLDARFANMSAEDIYRVLTDEDHEKDKLNQSQPKEAKRSQPKSDQHDDNDDNASDEGDETQGDDESQDGDSGDSSSRPGKASPRNKGRADSAPDDGEDETHEADDESGDEGDDESDPGSQAASQGDENQVDGDQDGDVAGDGTDGEDGDSFDEIRSVPANEREALEQRIHVEVAQAEIHARMCGQTPGTAILSDIIKARQARHDYREIINQIMTEVCAKDYSFLRVNKRHLGRGIVLPTLYAKSPGKIVIIIDCSGSVRQHEIEQFVGESASVLELASEGNDEYELVVMQVDAAVQSVQRFTSMDEFHVKLGGRGGTSFSPGFELIAANKDGEYDDIKAILYFTDGFGSTSGLSPNHYPEVPVTWFVLSDAGIDYLKAPFGEVIRIYMD